MDVVCISDMPVDCLLCFPSLSAVKPVETTEHIKRWDSLKNSCPFYTPADMHHGIFALMIEGSIWLRFFDFSVPFLLSLILNVYIQNHILWVTSRQHGCRLISVNAASTKYSAFSHSSLWEIFQISFCSLPSICSARETVQLSKCSVFVFFSCPVSSRWRYGYDTVLMTQSLYVDVLRTWCFMAKHEKGPHHDTHHVWRR